MSLRVLHLRPEGLAPYVAQLQALERDISYPLDADRFVLSHGGAYHPFFAALGEAHFLVALEGDQVVGCVVGVRKPVSTPRGEVMSVYLADLKVHPEWRGRRVPARLLATALLISLRRWSALHWRFAFGAAMRGERGDVMRSAKGLSLLRLGRPFALLDVYFASPSQLATLVARGFLTEESLVHYKTHEELDELHAEGFYASLRDRFSSDPGFRYQVEQGLELGATVFLGLYRGLHESRGRRDLRAAKGPHSIAAGFE